MRGEASATSTSDSSCNLPFYTAHPPSPFPLPQPLGQAGTKLLTVLALLGSGVPMTAWASTSGCLCTHGQSCWPSASTFARLQSQVSQPLIYPLPTASGCYPPSDPSGNCTAIHANWSDGNWRASMPGSMEAPNWEMFTFPNGTTDACYLNTTIRGTCEQGSVPVIGVDARSVEDIQTAVRFAVQQNLKLIVKNTGHDYLGRSAARGPLMIWTHNMKNITYNSVFTPQGSLGNETYDVVTLSAGVQWSEAYAAVNDYGRMMVGGVSVGGSVGSSGGWLAGGGHSPLSPNYGLGVDNAIEISVVLSTGEFLTTNNYQDSDLFWALRGGGGFTFGIITSVTYRTYPSVPVQLYTYQANTTNFSTVAGVDLGDEQLSFNYVAPDTRNGTAMAAVEAWRNYTRSLEPLGVVSSDETYSFPSFYVLFQSVYSSGSQNGRNIMTTSRLLSRDTVANRHTQVAEILVNCSVSFNTVAGGRVNQISADSAGVNPAWRNAVVESTCGFSWEDSISSTEFRGLVSQLKGWIRVTYDLTPNDGAYFNEGSLFEIDWQEAFFGSHYPRLKVIKDTYDPDRLFVVTEGVGSEDWNRELTCRH